MTPALLAQLPPHSEWTLVALGFVAGLVGGLAGLGGSMVMLPGLAFFVGYATPDKAEHHAYMAAALAVNVLVAIPAAWRHHANRSFKLGIFLRVLPGQLLGVLAGVLLSDRFSGGTLAHILGAIIIVVVIVNLLRESIAKLEHADGESRASTLALSSTSAVTGILSGLSGLGGGALVIPALQLVARVALKHAIAVSSAMLIFSSSIGAVVKASTLASHGQDWHDAARLALLMGFPAALGSILGAELTHRLHTLVLRYAVAAILVAASVRMLMA